MSPQDALPANQGASDRIDAALDSVLRASGSRLSHYTLPKTLEAMRAAMHKVMSDSYIAGIRDARRAP